MRIRLYLLLLLLSFGFSKVQSQSIQEVTGRWYSSNGTNELQLLLSEKYALYKADFWDVVEFSNGKLRLRNQEGETELSLRKNGNRGVLTANGVSLPVQNYKSTNISSREVGKTDVSKDFFKKDQVVLQGIVIPKDTMPLTISIIYNHAFSEGQKKFVEEVDSGGKFKIIYPLEYPQSVMVSVGDAFFYYFSTPGAKQAMVIDEASFKGSWTTAKKLDFMGDLAAENEEFRLLHPEYMKIRNYEENDSLQKTLDSDAYLEYRLQLWQSHHRFYESYFDSVPTSSFIKDYSLRDVRTYAADDLRRYIWMHNLGKNGGRIEAVDVSDEYLDKVVSLMPDEIGDLMTDNYANLTREFTMAAMPKEYKAIHDRSLKYVYEFLSNQSLSEENRGIINEWKEKERSRKNTFGNLSFKGDIKPIFESYKEDILDIQRKVRWDHLISKIAGLSTVQRSSIVATYVNMNFTTKGLQVPDYIQAKLGGLNLVPSVLESIEQSIADFEILKNARFVEGVEITESSDNILRELKEKYKGKVVYIDVWATWCGPCIGEFSNMKRIKESKIKDVVYVYLCAQSTKKSFDIMVKKHELVGDNYFLNEEQYQKLDKEVGITGFPTYLVITKDGKLVREGIKRPSAGEGLVRQLQEFSSRK